MILIFLRQALQDSLRHEHEDDGARQLRAWRPARGQHFVFHVRRPCYGAGLWHCHIFGQEDFRSLRYRAQGRADRVDIDLGHLGLTWLRSSIRWWLNDGYGKITGTKCKQMEPTISSRPVVNLHISHPSASEVFSCTRSVRVKLIQWWSTSNASTKRTWTPDFYKHGYRSCRF